MYRWATIPEGSDVPECRVVRAISPGLLGGAIGASTLAARRATGLLDDTRRTMLGGGGRVHQAARPARRRQSLHPADPGPRRPLRWPPVRGGRLPRVHLASVRASRRPRPRGSHRNGPPGIRGRGARSDRARHLACKRTVVREGLVLLLRLWR